MCEGGTKKLLHVLAGHQIIKPYVRMDKGMNVCEYVCMCVLVGGEDQGINTCVCRGTKNECVCVCVCVCGGGGGG